MASTAPLMSFLRPLAPPRPSTISHFLRVRYTTSAPCQAHKQVTTQRPQSNGDREDRNLIASRTAPSTYPPPSMKSLPRPKESRASHRSRQPQKVRDYPTRQPSHTTVAPAPLIPAPVTPLPEHQCAPNLAYFVTRTPSNELPVYTLRKRGGNLKMTRVKKVDGRVETLRDELRAALGLAEGEALVNPVTRHVMLKGHHGKAVEHFLRERMF